MAKHTGDRSVRFYLLILFFMASMIGLVMAQDLLLLFVFWELTTIASYFLIGFDSHKKKSRRAALMALEGNQLRISYDDGGGLLVFEAPLPAGPMPAAETPGG